MEQNELKDKEQEERETAEFAAQVFGGGEPVIAPKQEELNQVFDKNIPDISEVLKQDRLDYLSRHPDAVERDYRAERMRSQGFSRGPDLLFGAKGNEDLLSQVIGARINNLDHIWEMLTQNTTNEGSAERPKFKYKQESTDGE